LEQHGPVDGLLGGEVVEEAGASDADVVGDLVEAGALIAVVGEAPQRRLQDERLGVGRR
jgi:hypothetical protein